MKAISVLQPWAQLLICGVKTFDARKWRTSHRGPLTIHASRHFPGATRFLSEQEPMRSLLKAHGIAQTLDLPLGALIGTVELIDCVCVDALIGTLSPEDRARCDFGDNRWVWKFANACRLPEPIEYRGVLGVFEVNLASRAP